MLRLTNNVIYQNNLEKVEAKINKIYAAKEVEPHYQGDLPEGNNGLG
jgi:methylmalonyl-CoA mutase